MAAQIHSGVFFRGSVRPAKKPSKRLSAVAKPAARPNLRPSLVASILASPVGIAAKFLLCLAALFLTWRGAVDGALCYWTEDLGWRQDIIGVLATSMKLCNTVCCLCCMIVTGFEFAAVVR